MLPDGTPLYVKVAKAFSSESTRVGDVVDFAVAFEVRADGVVVIPQRTSLAGKFVSVSLQASHFSLFPLRKGMNRWFRWERSQSSI